MTSTPSTPAQGSQPTTGHTPTPWQWTIHDSSAASIHGPDEMLDHVLTVSPCKHCRGEEWKWGACTNPRQDDAAFILEAVNSHASLKARIEALEGALREILAAEDDFREGLPQEWEGDPLYDACQAARAALSSQETDK